MPSATDNQKIEPSHFGQHNILVIVPPVLFFISNLIVSNDRKPLSSSGEGILHGLQMTAGALTVIMLIAWCGTFRARRLARVNPSAVVLLTVKHKSLAPLMRELIKSQNDATEWVWIPQWLALKSDARGIEIWGGQFRFRMIYSEEWCHIGDITPAEVASGIQIFRGLSIPISRGETEVTMPLIITGSGLFGLFCMKAKRLKPIIDVMNRTATYAKLKNCQA